MRGQLSQKEEAIYRSATRTDYKLLSRIEQAVPALFAVASLAVAVSTVIERVLS